MQYLFLLYSDPSGWATMTPDQRQTAMGAYMDYSAALVAAGAYVGGNQLHGASAATTLSLADGTRRVQDGPFAASKEELGGYYLIEAPNLDAALDWAAKCPGARHGHVEVRPVMSRE